MNILLASLTMLAGVLMLASKSRKRFPGFAGGCAAILAGEFLPSFFFFPSYLLIALLGFCFWLASLPVLLACTVSLAVLATKDRRHWWATVWCAVAFLSNGLLTLSFSGFAF